MNERPEYQTDGRLPEVCCDTCPYAFPIPGAPKDFPDVMCGRRSPEAHPVPVQTSQLAVPGRRNNGGPQIGTFSAFPSMRRDLVCGDHPLFNQHPNMVRFNEEQAAKSRR
jgi:hypothetical protein